MKNATTTEKKADEIISMMEKAGLTPNQMLRVLRLAKQKMHSLKHKKEMEAAHV
jgi:hypothetical protein